MFIGLAVVPFLLSACSKAGSQYYKQAVNEIKETVIEYLRILAKATAKP